MLAFFALSSHFTKLSMKGSISERGSVCVLVCVHACVLACMCVCLKDFKNKGPSIQA